MHACRGTRGRPPYAQSNRPHAPHGGSFGRRLRPEWPLSNAQTQALRAQLNGTALIEPTQGMVRCRARRLITAAQSILTGTGAIGPHRNRKHGSPRSEGCSHCVLRNTLSIARGGSCGRTLACTHTRSAAHCRSAIACRRSSEAVAPLGSVGLVGSRKLPRTGAGPDASARRLQRICSQGRGHATRDETRGGVL